MLKPFKNEGKIGHIGLSSHNPIVARKAVETGKIEVLNVQRQSLL